MEPTEPMGDPIDRPPLPLGAAWVSEPRYIGDEYRKTMRWHRITSVIGTVVFVLAIIAILWMSWRVTKASTQAS